MNNSELCTVYYDKTIENVFTIVFRIFESLSIMKIDPIHHEKFDETEKTIIKNYCQEHDKNDSIEGFSNLSWLDFDYGKMNKHQIVLKVNNLIDEISKDNGKERALVDVEFFEYKAGDTKLTHITRGSTIENIQFKIENKKLLILFNSEIEIKDKNKVIDQITQFKIDNAPQYVVLKCPKCKKYCIHTKKTEAIAECNICHQNNKIVDVVYIGFDKHLASKQAAKANLELDSAPTKEKDLTKFFFKGKYHAPFEQFTVHNSIYTSHSSDSIFYEKDGKIYFKDEYLSYIKSLNKPEFEDLIENAQYELENLQIDEDKYFTIDVALYWFYNNYRNVLGSESLDRKSIFINKRIVFEDVDSFFKEFINADNERRQFLLCLLNPVYFEYFFLDENGNRIFDEFDFQNDIFIKITKFLFKNYNVIFIITYNLETEKVEINEFNRDILNSLISEDNLILDRYRLLRYIYENNINNDFGLVGCDLLGDIDHNSPDDAYAFNAYIYSVNKNDGFYYYKNLKIPLDTNDAYDFIKTIITNRYLYPGSNESKTRFDTLIEIYKKRDVYLSGYLVSPLAARLDSILHDLDLHNFSNLWKIYLNLMKNTPPNEVKFVYERTNSVVTLNELINIAIIQSNKHLNLYILSKDNQLQTILRELFANSYDEIYKNSEIYFQDMVNKINNFANKGE